MQISLTDTFDNFAATGAIIAAGKLGVPSTLGHGRSSTCPTHEARIIRKSYYVRQNVVRHEPFRPHSGECSYGSP